MTALPYMSTQIPRRMLDNADTSIALFEDHCSSDSLLAGSEEVAFLKGSLLFTAIRCVPALIFASLGER